MSNISRRDLFKFGGIAAASVAGASMLGGCSSQAPADKGGATAQSTPKDSTKKVAAAEKNVPDFFVKPDPIKNVAETKEYDVVVVGAGAAGVPAALSAHEAGAKVAVLQKEKTAVSQGNSGTGVILEESEPAGVQSLVSKFTAECCHRSRRDQVELWAKNSGEALKWLWDLSQKAGCSILDTSKMRNQDIREIDGHKITYMTIEYGPKPYNTGDGMQGLAKYAEGLGIDFFYETPAEQLVQDASGKVTGVIGKTKDGKYLQFNAKKGVIVSTGDYTANKDMMQFYNPDMKNIWRKTSDKTGLGQRMMVWAGGHMEDVCGSKIVHDFDSGPASMCSMPFLYVKLDGTRFCNEARTSMEVASNMLTSKADSGNYMQIFDGKYMTDCADWPGKLFDPEMLKNYMPEVKGEKKGVYEALINTHAADTLEELAKKLEITDVDAFVKTVKRYNELVEKGVDEDFGKETKWLKSITEPPFYGIHRHVGVSTIIHGVNVNEKMQVIKEDGTPIEGLYSIGNCAGNYYGSPDYPLMVYGMSLGRCHTQGYVVGKAVAKA